jgi:CheY-like chemotaxis protein
MRTILLIEEDDETRRLLSRNLRDYGYRVIAAHDEADALERGGDDARADLILVDLVGESAESGLEAGRRVRERARYDVRTPLVAMPERYGKEVEGTEVNVAGNDWVFYLGEEPGQLRNFLSRLLPPRPGPTAQRVS